MDDRELLVYLHTIKGVGWNTLSRIVSSFNTLAEIFSVQPLELSMLSGIEYSVAEMIINNLQVDKINRFKNLLFVWGKNNIKIVTYFDSDYPAILKEIANPPWVLFAFGDLNFLHQHSIAIVGTRSPTNYGKIVSEQLAKELVDYDFVVTSGLARGIDRLAHEGTLAKQGKTIAVMGNGIDVVYPKENQKIYDSIRETGLVISEYPPGTRPHPGYFPRRNRIISGLSLGTIIVEASSKSGSLITAQFALEQSREVFAVPGPITSQKSLGTNSLIKQGAKLIQSIEDVIEEFTYIHKEKFQKNEEKLETLNSLNNSEQMVYLIVQSTPIHIDEIYDQVSMDLSNLYESLLSLQLKGVIKQLSGGLYVRQT
ncbi:DNA protecting protein DprA [Vulcanibacillus modesticaldus]|uniref:DNA protecting protein DprA n=1 Tax=Vulcanibacillus modesticaldus TaxID=337097 RepID=A0A1D2YXE9_9BACI|nr:DNA-processing protein DprA [Vulcanibacillus modesticaldus]OEG00389.1 DNA protecting protein DprA [Vulcanibacillus modesticaldus]